MHHALNALAPRHNQGYEFSRSSTQQQAKVGDELAISARSKRVALKTDGATGVEDSHRNRGFEHAAKHMVKKALRAVKHDLGHMFKSFGFDRQAGKELAKSLIQPVKDALRSGADFTAQIKMMALSQETKVSGNSVSQNLFLVAKSIEIDVNRTTGEVSIETSSLKLQQSLSADFQPIQASGFSLPALDDILPGAIKDLLGGGADAAETPPAAATQDEQLVEALADDAAEAAGKTGDAEKSADNDDKAVRNAEGREGLGEARERGEAKVVENNDDDDDGEDDAVASAGPVGTPQEPGNPDAVDGEAAVGAVLEQQQTRIRIRAVQQVSNDLGQFVTRIRLDAAIDLSRFTAGDDTFLQSARAEAKGSFLSLRA